MGNNRQTLNSERINEVQVRPEKVDLEVIKNKISEFLEKSQNLSNAGMDSLLNEVNGYLVSNLENLHVNYRLKESNPLLYVIHKKQGKYPRLHKLFGKRIKKLVNKFKNEHRENHKSCSAYEIGNFISENIPKDITFTDFRKREMLRHIYGVIQLANGNLERSNTFFNMAQKSRILNNMLADAEMKFSTENLREILSNPNTTIKNLEETAAALFPKNSDGIKTQFSDEFIQGCRNNIEKLEEELKNKEILEESKYNYYANICYLKSFITYDDAKREDVDADTKYKEANELLDKGNLYSFYSNKENLQKFIEDNCFRPDVLYKKTQDLWSFYGTYFNKDKQGEVFNSLDKIIKNLKEEFENSNEKLAAINFFEANCLVLSSGNENDRYFNCRKDAMSCYSKINSNEAKIACLSVGRICNNDLDKDENDILKHSYDNLLKLTETNELYKKAQYECGKYIKNEDKNKAFEYFKNSADKGCDKAKIEVIEYYTEKYKQAKKGSTKENIRKNVEVIASTLPEEYNEKKAEIYEKIDNQEKAIECYNKLKKEADNKKNYTDNASKLKKIFIKISDCFTRLGDKIFNRNNNINNEESDNCYKKAIKNCKNSESTIKGENFSIESRCKIALNYKKMNDFKNYKAYLKELEIVCFNNLTEEKLKDTSESVKNLIAYLCFDLSKNKNLIYTTVDTASESGREKKAKEYLKIAADLGHQEALVEYIEILLNSNIGNEEEISNISKKLKTPEAKYKVAYKLRLKYKELSFKLFKEAADSGNVKAKYEVARMLKSGIGVERNEKKAIELFKKLTKSDDLDIRRDSIIITIDTFIEQKNKNELKLIIKNYDKNIINDENLNNKIQLAKFTIAKICKSRINEEKNKQETIKLFKELASSPITNNINIKIKSIIELGYIYFNLWKSNNENQEYKDNLKKYLEEDFNLYIQLVPKEKLDKFNDKLEFFRILKGSLINKEDKAYFKLSEIYLNGTNIKKDKKSAIKNFKYLAKNSASQSIRVDSLIALGDIYSEDYKKESFVIARSYYQEVLRNYYENNNKFDEVQNRFIILSNKESVLNYNEKTEKSEIEEIVDSTMKYLNKLKITIEEKKQKFEKFANVLKSKISGGKKSFINKVSEDKILFIDDMLKASNEFFANSINSINK